MGCAHTLNIFWNKSLLAQTMASSLDQVWSIVFVEVVYWKSPTVKKYRSGFWGKVENLIIMYVLRSEKMLFKLWIDKYANIFVLELSSVHTSHSFIIALRLRKLVILSCPADNGPDSIRKVNDAKSWNNFIWPLMLIHHQTQVTHKTAICAYLL